MLGPIFQSRAAGDILKSINYIMALAGVLIAPIPKQAFRSVIYSPLHIPVSRGCLQSASVRHASNNAKKEEPEKKKKLRTTFRQFSLKDAEQFALCDAIR